MNNPLQPEELQAILAAVAPKQGPTGATASASVAPRDFARPQRLSLEQRGELRELLVRVLPGLERELSNTLRSRARVSLSDVDESDAQLAIGQLRQPLAVAPFSVAGQPCWVVWDSVAAVAALELALGAPEASSSEPRKLTSVEGMLFKRVANTLLAQLAPVLGFTAENLRVATLMEDIGSPRDAGDRYDPRRLLILLELEIPAGTSVLRLYLPPPMANADANRAGPVKVAALPRHLDEVQLSVSARLGAADLLLADLLALQVGDVIPLGVQTSTPLEVWAEDRPWANALLGSHGGHLALRLHSGGRKSDEGLS